MNKNLTLVAVLAFFASLSFCLFALWGCSHNIIDYGSVENIVYMQHVQPLFQKIA